ncbi:hypothetical protein [uncultured Brachyspira sp.]|uniref:hypothetical protein n=1 Tax=uncultured Brachyspira sp. TaxID=221953 RepID=UPI0025D469E7|nr:hypothetical protein [uncultured Brachyspira sp.]
MKEINNKIGSILENNLISNLIIIFLGIISSFTISVSIFIISNKDAFIFRNIFFSYSNIFYFFSLSLIFYINKNFNLKNILIIFLLFTFIFIVSLSTDFLTSIFSMHNPNMQIYIIKYVFSALIFFIIMALSYNGFEVINSKSISEFFTFFADILIFSGLIVFLLSVIFVIFIAIVMFFIHIDYAYQEIILKLIITVCSFISALFPFLVYIIYKKIKTNISIYLSRILMPFSLLFIFILLIFLLMPDIRPYNNRVVFMLYNIMLAIIVLNLLFVRADYKSGIFTKALYIVLPIITILFDVLVLTSSLYRLIEYGISPNKITLIGTNLIMLGNLIFITFFNIKSVLIVFKKTDNIPDIKEITIGDTKSMLYIYVYGIWAFIVCFIMPPLIVQCI